MGFCGDAEKEPLHSHQANKLPPPPLNRLNHPIFFSPPNRLRKTLTSQNTQRVITFSRPGQATVAGKNIFGGGPLCPMPLAAPRLISERAEVCSVQHHRSLRSPNAAANGDGVVTCCGVKWKCAEYSNGCGGGYS